MRWPQRAVRVASCRQTRRGVAVLAGLTAPVSGLAQTVPGRSESRSDSVYATAALQTVVAAVAASGREIPANLRGYRALVESEIALIIRTAGDRQSAASGGGGAGSARERVLQVEQIESTLSWQRDGAVEQHIAGYRFRAVTASISALSYFRRPWVVPVLYGNRLQVLFGHDSIAAHADSLTNGWTTDSRSQDVVLAIHPFADDREQFYRFAGGDTVAVLHLQERVIPIVRIMVEPVEHTARRTLVFRGEIDIDASRMQVVRMKGQFVVVAARASRLRRMLASNWQTIAFAELVNGEYDGRFWLPTEQRIEGQARTALAGEFSPIVRVVSHFSHYVIADGNTQPTIVADSNAVRVRLTMAPRDSLSAYDGWRTEIGVTTGLARAEDFHDVAPDTWRPRGAPRVDWRAERVNDVLRYNRVEGAYTGIAATLRFRDAAPGLTVGAQTGWAWAERTARGAAWGRWLTGGWSLDARAERALANTNDFRPLLDFEQSLGAVLATADDYDYVDRRSATVGITRALRLPGAPLLRLESGIGNDRSERTRLRYGLVHLDSTFRPNRPVTAGSYVRTGFGLDIHPDVSGEFLAPGIGASLWYERGDGALRWQRVETRVAARRTYGPFLLTGRIDAIAVFSSQVLPQQLIEIGENEGLHGYAYKEFGGDRAALARTAMTYNLPFLRAPLKLGRWSGPLASVYLPSVSPSLALGVQGAWSDAISSATRLSLGVIGTRQDSLTRQRVPATRPTGGVRSTASLTLRVFGGTLGIGVARPLDRVSPNQRWRLVFGAGQSF